MDFSIPEPMQDMLAAIRELMEREVFPLEPVLRSQPFSELVPALESESGEKVKALGLWAPQIPKAIGGLGLNCVEYALVGEELGRSPLGHYVVNGQAPDAGNMEILREFGTIPQQRAVVDAPGARRDPQLLRHDRARSSRLESGLDGDHRGPGRR